MAQHAVLDNISHKDIRIISQRGAGFGDNVSLTTAFIRNADHFDARLARNQFTRKVRHRRLPPMLSMC